MLWRKEGDRTGGWGGTCAYFRWTGRGDPHEEVTKLERNRWEGASQNECWLAGGGNTGKGFGAA